MEDIQVLKKIVTEKEIVDYTNEKKLLIDKEAIHLLQKVPDYKQVLDDLAEKEFIIKEETVNNYLLKKETKLEDTEKPKVIVKKSGYNPIAKEMTPNLKLLDEYDVTDKSLSEGDIKDFLNYFRDKFEFLENLLKKRPNFQAKPINRITRVTKGNDFDTIGMINKKWVSKNGHFIIEIEDTETKCLVLIMKDKKELVEINDHLILDTVIGVKGSKLSDDMIIANEILLPDIPQKTFKKAKREVSIVSISDIHVGSKLFLEKEFNKFLNWINGNIGTNAEKEEIGKIKYMVVCGDLTDGVGIYPNQYDELAIKDIYKQYEIFSNYLKQIPEYIEIIVAPGNHDAVRRADPQPALSKEFTKDLDGYKNIHFVGSPSWFEVEGLKSVVYHGASLHDLYSQVNFLSNKEPQKAIIELLKRRDLMTTFGMHQPYVPEKKDYMLIREEPDLFFGGDMHHSGYAQYRGCLIIYNGTWQKQTEFQQEQGHDPTPGTVPVVRLDTGNIKEYKFYEEENDEEI